MKPNTTSELPRGSSAGTDASDHVSRQSWLSLALVSSATFIIILDLMATNVAFPFIELEFDDTPRSTLAWVSSGNAIAAAALLLVAGRLADRHGRRRIFLIGLAIFTIVSAVTAAAPNPTVLIAARVGQGAGAAIGQGGQAGGKIGDIGHGDAL